MKWNRWIIKAAKIITKFTELGYWMTAALMLTAGIYSFADRTFLADALAGSIRTGRLELSVLGFEFSVPTANGIDMRAMLLYFAAAVVLPSLMAMIFRNLPAVRRHDHLFAPIESLASLDFGENRITNTDLSNPADPALKKVIVDPGYEFELVTTLFKNRPDVSIVTE